MISSELLEVIACPLCKSPLKLAAPERLQCVNCRRIYPIRDGIPILLVEESQQP